MERIKAELRRIREAVGAHQILLEDGTRHFYNRGPTSVELFMHTASYLQAEQDGKPRPAPPEILQAVVQARDRRGAVSQLYPGWEAQRPFSAFDLHALVERGEIRYLPLPPDPVAEPVGEG